jgi:predicted RNA methylase
LKEFLPFSFRSKPKVSGTATVCITGKLKSFSTKAEATKLLEQAGFRVIESVTKSLDYLVDEQDNGSSKRKKAEEYGVIIINDLNQFLKDNRKGFASLLLNENNNPILQLNRECYFDAFLHEYIIDNQKNHKEYYNYENNLKKTFYTKFIRNIKKEFQFFATPATIAEKLCSYIPENTFSVLEPSAGQGAIVQAINKIRPDVVVAYCELMELNRKQFKGDAIYVQDDFLTIDTDVKYDCVIANPPFSKNQDIEHFYRMVLVARKRIISIMSTHWIHSTHKRETQFREFLEQMGAQVIPIEAGEFKESGTNIPTCIVVMDTREN